MFYEEKLINGLLMFRGTPDGDWMQLSIEKLSLRVVEAEVSVKIMQERWDQVIKDVREQAYLNGKQYEKDRMKELLGLAT